MPSGWNANFPNDMIWDVAVLSREVATVQTPLFVTRGGNNARRNNENRQVPFDGSRVPIAGLDRGIGSRPEFSGTALQIDETTLAIFEPGSTLVTVAGPPAVHTITPLKQSLVIAKTMMMLKPRLTWARSGGGSVYMQFPYGFVLEWDINAQDKSEGEIPFRIESRLDPAAVGFTTDDPGYVIVVTDPTP
jgi:hypothetical protein